MFKKYIKNQRGLTLVELLAVIVILGIISSIAVPSIGGIIQKTKEDATVAEALQIINAAKLAHASNGAPEEGWSHDGDKPTGVSSAPGTDADYKALNPYLDSVDDKVYYVTYTNRTYTIFGHDAEDEGIVDNNDGNDGLTKQELLDYTGN